MSDTNQDDQFAVFRTGARAAVVCGPDNKYELRVKFGSLLDLQEAEEELRAALAASREALGRRVEERQTAKPQAAPAAFIVTNLPSGEPSLCFEDERGDYGNEQFTPVFEPLYLAAPAQAAIDAREQEDAARYRELRENSHPLTGRFDITEGDPPRHLYGEMLDAALASRDAAPAPAAAGGLTDEQIMALNAGERFFSESPSRFPEAGHGTQYHAGGPGVLGFARAVLALAQPAPVQPDEVWAAYVAGIIENYLGQRRDRENRETAIAGIIARRMCLLQRQPAAPVQQEAECDRAPVGWHCTREQGHAGPCAAQPLEAMTKEWCAAHPGSAAYMINALAKEADLSRAALTPPAVAAPAADGPPLEGLAHFHYRLEAASGYEQEGVYNNITADGFGRVIAALETARRTNAELAAPAQAGEMKP